MREVCWVDGELAPLDQPVVSARDSAFASGLGCYSSARVAAGSVLHEDRHVERLVSGARELGLGGVTPELARRAFRELARAAFGDGEGVVRVQVSRDGAGGARVVGVPRDLGEEPLEWSAVLAPLPHDGAQLSGGLKVTSRLTLTLAHEAALRAGAREALLLDAADRLVEAAGSNVFVVTREGDLVTPPLARGAVAGIARTLVLERVSEAHERDVSRDALLSAREIVATNAVRGARPITRLDGVPVGTGQPGPWSTRLGTVLEK